MVEFGKGGFQSFVNGGGDSQVGGICGEGEHALARTGFGDGGEGECAIGEIFGEERADERGVRIGLGESGRWCGFFGNGETTADGEKEERSFHVGDRFVIEIFKASGFGATLRCQAEAVPPRASPREREIQ